MGYYKNGLRTEQYYSKSVVEGNTNWFSLAPESINWPEKQDINNAIDREMFFCQNSTVYGCEYNPKSKTEKQIQQMFDNRPKE